MYTYKVTIIPTKQYYFGARYAKKAKLEELGESYFTTSALVQKLIFTYGINAVSFEVLNTFKSKEECLKEETKLINDHLDDQLSLNRQWNKETATKISLANKIFNEKFPEKRLTMTERATDGSRNTVWINDGNHQIRLKKDKEIPFGFQKGRLKN